MATYQRMLLLPFSSPNPVYGGATLTLYQANKMTGLRTSTLATLYQARIGTTQFHNPLTLDGYGKVAAPVYIDCPVVPVITNAGVPAHELGAYFPNLIGAGDWNTPLMLGSSFVWAEAGKLYINTTAPTSATDGTVVETQT